MKIVKVSSSLGSMNKNKGCEKAPDIICSHFPNAEIDYVKNTSNLDEMQKELQEKEGDIFIGGSHDITYGSFKGLKGKNKGILILDAHADLDFGTETVSHEDFVRKLIEEGDLKKENLVYVGLRKIYPNEVDFIKKNKIKYFDMDKIFDLGIKEVCDFVMEICREFSDLYLSIDIDVVDPAFAPGTGYLEPGGLSSREILYLVKRLKILNNLKRVDLVEINPDKDENKKTIQLGMKIVEELK